MPRHDAVPRPKLRSRYRSMLDMRWTLFCLPGLSSFPRSLSAPSPSCWCPFVLHKVVSVPSFHHPSARHELHHRIELAAAVGWLPTGLGSPTEPRRHAPRGRHRAHQAGPDAARQDRPLGRDARLPLPHGPRQHDRQTPPVSSPRVFFRRLLAMHSPADTPRRDAVT